MGTMLALLLVLSTLSGCARETLTDLKNALPEPAPREIFYQLDYSSYEESFLDYKGNTLAYCDYTAPQMSALREDGSQILEAQNPEEERALELTETFNLRFADWRADAPRIQELLAQAPAQNGQPLVEQLTCTAYQTGRLVSVSAEYHNYTGGAHGNTILLSWNFDLDSGTFFDAATLDDDAGFHAAVVRALKRQAQNRAQENSLSPTDFFWEDYEEILENWTSYAVSFDEEGMTVAFSPYELACYAAGEQVFHLTYEELLPHMGPRGRALLGLEAETEEASER